jgi:7,8-dihydroneopterin aldolase/epimerase/oxygenase
MDTIIISELEVAYQVGVTADERSTPQRLLLSLELSHDFAKAAASDELTATINYDALCRRLSSFGHNREWKLIETLAVDVAEMVLKDFGPLAVVVEVKKFIIPQARYVGVRVKRPL